MTLHPPRPCRLPALEVAAGTVLLRRLHRLVGAPLTLYANTLVIRASDPVVVLGGSEHAQLDDWLRAVGEVVDPTTIRWLLPARDGDGADLAAVLAACPRAVLVTSWAGCLHRELSGHPVDRVWWVDDRIGLDVGNRLLRLLRLPFGAGPASYGLFDPATDVLWAADAFAVPMPAEPVSRLAELPDGFWTEGLAMTTRHALAPWLSSVHPPGHATVIERLRALDPAVVVGAHTPVVDGAEVTVLLDHLASLPDVSPPPHPAVPPRMDPDKEKHL